MWFCGLNFFQKFYHAFYLNTFFSFRKIIYLHASSSVVVRFENFILNDIKKQIEVKLLSHADEEIYNSGNITMFDSIVICNEKLRRPQFWNENEFHCKLEVNT